MTARLTMGPVLFNWPAARLADFYRRVADEAPVDTVVIGEVVCSKRPLAVDALGDAVDRLARAGKQVISASLALVMQPRERQSVRVLAAQADMLVEANDATALALLRGRPHAVGPYVSVYNEGSLRALAENGAMRICLGPDLSFESIEALAHAAEAVPHLALEIMAFGRLPLAISARCYHARAHQLQKDGCQFVCAQDPDGLLVETVDGRPFLAVNGVQVLGATYASLITDLPRLAGAGIRSFRLSPHSGDMVKTSATFRDVLDGKCHPEEGQRLLELAHPSAVFANGFLQGLPGKTWLATMTRHGGE